MGNIEQKQPKATRVQVERMKEIYAELNKIEGSFVEELEFNHLLLLHELDNLKENYDWLDEVFEENNKKGLKNILGEVVVPAIYDKFGMLMPYYMETKPVGALLDGNFGLVKRDGKGTPVTEFIYRAIIPIPFCDVYVVFNKEDRSHFALMMSGRVITPYEIENHEMPCDDAIIISADGKKGIFYYGYDIVYIKPEYDEVYSQGIGENFIFVKDGKKGYVTLDKRFISIDDLEMLDYEEYEEISKIGFISSPDID